jgi:hypothetical protein
VITTLHPRDSTSDPDVTLVRTTSTDHDDSYPHIVVADVVRDDHPLRHDPDKLAVVLMRVLKTAEQRTSRSSNGTLRAAT